MSHSLSTRRRAAFFGILVGFACVASGAAGYLVARILGGGGGREVDLAVSSDPVKAPPFYELVFEQAPPPEMHEALLPDPVTKVRGRPMYAATGRAGPHDAIGFRGEASPVNADIVTIGDSQTYGWGVKLADNWPSQLAAISGRAVYNMALGGWGGAQYWYLAGKAMAMKPKVLVVGLYMGNDSIESLTQVYQSEFFARFRLPGHATLQGFDLKLEREDPVQFELGGVQIAFTPHRRLFVNDRSNEAVVAGYRVLANLCGELARAAAAQGAAVAFLIIPTKESVYAPLLQRQGVDVGAVFTRLATDEAQNLAELQAAVRAAGARVVDVTDALRRAALAGTPPYPLDADGHPAPLGYRVIAEAAAGLLAADGATGK